MNQVATDKSLAPLSELTDIDTLPGGPDWMTRYRRQAKRLYPEVEKPRWEGTRLKHRSLRRFDLDQFAFPTKESEQVPPENLPEQLRQFMNSFDGAAVATLNGQKTARHIPEEFKEKGVIIQDLNRAAREHREIVEEYFLEHYPLTDDDDYAESIKFLALNQALWTEGTFIHVPPGTTLENPIRIEELLTEQANGIATRNLIVAGRDTEFTVIENIQSDGAPDERLRTHTNEVFVKEGARVRYASLQNIDQNTFNAVFRKASVARDGHFEWILGDLGGWFNLYYNLTEARGEGSTGELKGIFFGNNNQRFRFQNYMTQSGPHTNTNMVANGALSGTSRLVYLGLARILEGAKGANARQSEKSLLLESGARNDAIPELEIDEDDVIAEHAATVGEVDDENVHYLMTRGLPREKAERLIVEGSFFPVIEEINNDTLREEVLSQLHNKLNKYYASKNQ